MREQRLAELDFAIANARLRLAQAELERAEFQSQAQHPPAAKTADSR
jgi:hypothetical protein